MSVKNLDNDRFGDIVVGAGSGAGSKVTAYRGSGLAAGGLPPVVRDFDAFPGFAGGVFVG